MKWGAEAAPSAATLAYGRRIAQALLGLDALYRRESADEDGLVVVQLAGSEALIPDAFATYDEAERLFGALRRDAGGLPEADRRRYYDDLCHSSLAFVRWRAHGLPFASQLRDFLHVPAEPASEADLDALRQEMGVLLDRLGYPGALPAQCAAWEERHRVTPAEVPGVMRELLDAAWERTEARLLEIPAPRSDGMRVAGVSGVAFNARCDYRQRSIELNTDPILTRPGLKHLAVHEAYPGHYVQFKLRETLAAEGRAPADVLLSVVNTASSSVFEGIGDTGTLLLDWMDSDDDRLQVLMNRYRAGIGTGAAWGRHTLGWSEEEVAAWLAARSLIGGEGWVANRVRFVSEPARAVLIWSYWWGEPLVRGAWERAPRGRKADFLLFLHGRMHSNASVGMFE